MVSAHYSIMSAALSVKTKCVIFLQYGIVMHYIVLYYGFTPSVRLNLSVARYPTTRSHPHCMSVGCYLKTLYRCYNIYTGWTKKMTQLVFVRTLSNLHQIC